MAATLAIRRAWRPPANPVASQVSTMAKASLSARKRPPRQSTLASLSNRDSRAASMLAGTTARMPRTLPAAMAMPWPVAQTRIPSDPGLPRTALATA